MLIKRTAGRHASLSARSDLFSANGGTNRRALQLGLVGIQKNVRRTGGTVFDILPVVSAAQAIPALDKVESLLRFAAGIHVIQRDGYSSKEEFVNSLCRRLKAEFDKRADQKNVSEGECK